MVTAIKGHRLTVQEQKQLYSGQGLTKAFRKQDGTVYRFRFGVVTKPGQKDVLTECILTVQERQEAKPVTYNRHVIKPSKVYKGRKI